MRMSAIAWGWWCLACWMLAPSSVHAQQSRDAGAEEQALMQRWVEFMTPGAEHELLKKRIGQWTVELEMRATADGEPTVSKGTCEIKSIMGGRYIMDTTRSDFQGQSFEGHSITGYDKLKKKFRSVWFDNFGTGFTISTGSYDEASKTFQYATMSPDVALGQYKQTRTLERVVSDDRWILEMYDTTPEGNEFRTLKAVYTRVQP